MPKNFSTLSKRQRNRRTLLLYKAAHEVASQPVSNIDDNSIDDPSCSSAIEFEEIEDGMMETINLGCTSSEIIDSDNNDESDNLSSSSSEQSESHIPQHPQKHSHLSLANDLCQWANEFRINQNAVTSLLRVLSKHGHNNLPGDARTLLSTPRSGTHEINNLSIGQYVHYGLLKALTSIAKYFPHAFRHLNIINLDLNIDGLPIAKSSKSQLWPILGRISSLPFAPFVIGVYHGYQKACLSEFLQPFIDEYLDLKNNGFCNKSISVLLFVMLPLEHM